MPGFAGGSDQRVAVALAAAPTRVEGAEAPLRVTLAGDMVVSLDGESITVSIGQTEDAAHASGDTGVMALAVRRDSAAASSGTDGDYEPLSTDSTGRLRVAAAPANSGVDIGDVDVTSVVPGTGATNLGKAEDAAHASGDVGLMALGVRRDVAAASSGTDGDYEPISMDNTGRLRIAAAPANSGVDIGDVDILSIAAGDNNIGNVDVLSVIPGTGATNAGKAVDSAAGATDTGTAPLAVRDDALGALTPVEGDYVNLRVDANGALWTHDDALDAALGGSELQVDVVGALPTGANTIGAVTNSVLSVVGGGLEATAQRVTIASDSTGVLSVDDNGGALTVDNGGTFAVQATLAAGAAAIAKAEDVASADADVGVPAMAVRKATPANTSGTDGDYEMIQMSAGRLWTSATVDAALPAGTNAIGKLAANSGIDIGDVDVTSVIPGTGATNLGKAEDAVHASGDVGVQMLAVRDDTLAAFSGAENDYEPLHTNAVGALYVQDVPNISGGLSFYKTIDLDESEEEVKGSAGQLYGLMVFNMTAAPLFFKIYNATAANVTVGTTVPDITLPIPGNNDSDGAGFVTNFVQGLAFSTAITVACTTAAADNDAGAPAAGACIALITYK